MRLCGCAVPCVSAEMDNRDKDYRYMACSDLNTELSKVGLASLLLRAAACCCAAVLLGGELTRPRLPCWCGAAGHLPDGRG